VAVAADVESLFARLQQTFGGLDVLVSNAGVFRVSSMVHGAAE
jgi:NAD(P)-dependent dehydrogenase (short-subunit alcohol dehydrogenase family)